MTTRPVTARTAGTDQLLQKALTLSARERADVAMELLRSLDGEPEDPAEVEAAWAEEIERRLQDDESESIPWEEIRAESIARLRPR